MTVREQIVSAIIVALQNGAAKPATVFRTRSEALSSPEHLPAIVVYPINEHVARDGKTIASRVLTVRAECIIAGPPSAEVDLDPLIEYAVETVLNDPDVQALVWGGVEEARTAWDFESSDEDLARAAVDFEVPYLTTRGNLNEARG